MKFLVEVMNSAMLLSHTQKGILAALHNSPTPQLGYEAITGTEALAVQRRVLENVGLISINGISASLTQSGEAALIANNIVDEFGELTADAKTYLDMLSATKSTIETDN